MKKALLYMAIIFFFLLSNSTYADTSFDFDVSKTACDDGNATECLRISIMHIEGTEDIDKDYKKAKIYADKACRFGNNHGCMIFLNIDEEAAKELLEQSCEDGNATACKKLQIIKDKKYYLIDGKCSKCGSTHIGKYLYGLIRPDKKMNERIKRGEIRLGGCMVSKDSPKYHCMKCGVDLYEKEHK